MVLQDLGNRLTLALKKLNASTVVDDDVVTYVIQDVSRALLESDVNVKIVGALRNNIKSKLNLEVEAMGINKRKLVQKVVMDELVNIVFVPVNRLLGQHVESC